jgi:hypothetical protein
VINDEIGGNLWVDALRVDAELARSIAQRGKINDRWNAREILEHDACRREGEFALISRRRGRRARLPREIRADIFRSDKPVASTTRSPFNQDLQDDGESIP